MSSALRGGFGLDWGCAWGQRPQLGWLPPTCHPVHLLLPSLLLGAVPLPPPIPLFHLVHSPLAYALYARPRCGRRRLGQVRLSLGFNIGENTGFYLIARYVSLCPFPRAAGTTEKGYSGQEGERERERESERERRRRLQVEEARRLSRERERKGGGREGGRE